MNGTCSIHEPIKKSSMNLFKHPSPKQKMKQSVQLNLLKSDVDLFSKLYIATQHREGNLAEFFKHENHPFPPSLSDCGKLRLGKKSDLLSLIEQDSQPEPPEKFDTVLLDGAAVIHALSPRTATTFDEYADSVFVPHIKRQLETSRRVDIVWDRYLPKSLKESTREKRGSGVRRKVAGKTQLPGK